MIRIFFIQFIPDQKKKRDKNTVHQLFLVQLFTTNNDN